MAYDDTKSNFTIESNVPDDQKLTAEEYNNLVDYLQNHASDHESGGGQEISVAGLSGVLTDPQPPQNHNNTAHTETYLTGIDIEDSGTVVVETTNINFADNLAVSDDGDGTVTVDASGGGGETGDARTLSRRYGLLGGT